MTALPSCARTGEQDSGISVAVAVAVAAAAGAAVPEQSDCIAADAAGAADTSSAPAASTPVVGASAAALASLMVEPILVKSVAAAATQSGSTGAYGSVVAQPEGIVKPCGKDQIVTVSAEAHNPIPVNACTVHYNHTCRAHRPA